MSTLTLTTVEAARETVSQKGSKNPFGSRLWNITGLPMVMLAAAWLSWGEMQIPLQAFPMILLAGIVYAGLQITRHRAADHRSYRTIGITFFYASAGYLFIFAALAAAGLYFSRSFLLSSYILTGVWMGAGAILFPKVRPAYYVIKGGIANKLKDLDVSEWNFKERLPRPERLSEYDGLVVDLHAHAGKTDILKGLSRAGLHGVPIIHAASVLEEYQGRTDLDYVAEEGLYELSSQYIYPALKRIFEISLILIASPFILVVAASTALAIKATSPGPVLFTQLRVGRHGHEYTLYKFRSMRAGADKEGAKFTLENDDRLTPIGQFIRKFRIDELPQFWNVLKGEMNLIGPRPEQKYFVEYFDEEIPFYSYRHKVRPGITGWAQIKDGYAADLDSTKIKLQHDLYYIKNLSLSLDLLIVYATVKTILTGFGSR